MKAWTARPSPFSRRESSHWDVPGSSSASEVGRGEGRRVLALDFQPRNRKESCISARPPFPFKIHHFPQQIRWVCSVNIYLIDINSRSELSHPEQRVLWARCDLSWSHLLLSAADREAAQPPGPSPAATLMLSSGTYSSSAHSLPTKTPTHMRPDLRSP